MMQSDLGVILARLDAYARLHFEREERLQVATAFPYSDAHHQRHRAIARDLTAMGMEFDDPRDPQNMKAFHDGLCGFLNHWLLDPGVLEHFQSDGWVRLTDHPKAGVS
jgi:hemerythrin